MVFARSILKRSFEIVADWTTHNFPFRLFGRTQVCWSELVLALRDLALGVEPVLNVVAVLATALLVHMKSAHAYVIYGHTDS